MMNLSSSRKYIYMQSFLTWTRRVYTSQTDRGRKKSVKRVGSKLHWLRFGSGAIRLEDKVKASLLIFQRQDNDCIICFHLYKLCSPAWEFNVRFELCNLRLYSIKYKLDFDSVSYF